MTIPKTSSNLPEKSPHEFNMTINYLGTGVPTAIDAAETKDGKKFQPYGMMLWTNGYFDLTPPTTIDHKKYNFSLQGGELCVYTNQKHPPHGDKSRPVSNYTEPHADDSFEHSPVVFGTPEDQDSVLLCSFAAYLGFSVVSQNHQFQLRTGQFFQGFNTEGNSPKIVLARMDSISNRNRHGPLGLGLTYTFNNGKLQSSFDLVYRYWAGEHFATLEKNSNVKFSDSPNAWQLNLDFFVSTKNNGDDPHHEEEE